MEKTAEDPAGRDRLPLFGSSITHTQHRRVFHRLVSFLGIVSCLWLTLHWLPIALPKLRISSCHHHTRPAHDGVPFDDATASMNPTSADSERVPFEAHIMSKCPDARDCIRELVVPTMERVHDKVDFDLSFIASISNQSSDVDCMHGPGECVGNMLMLCAANLPFPSEGNSRDGKTPTVRYLGFATCLISSYEDIPDRTLVEQCALEHGIDFEALNECVSQQDDNPNKEQEDRPLSGVALLRESARHSADLGVRTSCTVRLDDTVWCVRDGGVWKDCAEEGQGSQVSVLVDEIEKLWGQRN
ncbi:GILT family protein [Aspergillus undulatus]|uniref:GILT family protein n=1 Tax=Aspergillus undulatus TaxID=1810928 RepID=UPI003CCD75F6